MSATRNCLKIALFTFFVILSSSVMAQERYTDAYGALLHDYVHAGSKAGIDANLVDYAAWAKDSRHVQAMKAIEAVDVSALTPCPSIPLRRWCRA